MLGETARNMGLSIKLDCTFNSLHTHARDTVLGDLLWAIDAALVPSPAIAKEIQTVRAALDPSGSGAYDQPHDFLGLFFATFFLGLFFLGLFLGLFFFLAPPS